VPHELATRLLRNTASGFVARSADRCMGKLYDGEQGIVLDQEKAL
jgi:hypothetical protein